MNKAEMIKKVAQEVGYTQKDVASVVEAVINTVVDTVASGEDVKIAGLGAFTVATRGARIGRNPATGEEIEIGETKSPRFKAAKGFKDAVKA